MQEKELELVEMAASIIPPIVVSDAQSFEDAGAICAQITEVEKKIKDYWGPVKAASYSVWKGLCVKENAMLDPLKEQKDAQKLEMKRWVSEEEAKRQAALTAQASTLDVGEVVPTALTEASVVVPAGYGAFVRRVWSVTSVDMPELLKAVQDGRVPTGVVQPNMEFIRSQLLAKKEAFSMPGVVVEFK